MSEKEIKEKKYKGFATDWGMMAYHKCGDLISIPSNNTDFLTHFLTYCPKCGEKYESCDLETFTGKFVFIGKWYNPLTYFDVKVVKKS